MTSNSEIKETIDLRSYVEKHGGNVGFKIPPKGYVEIQAIRDDDGEVYPFHILSACLGPDAVPKERAILTFASSEAEEVKEVVCASLSIGNAENVPVDLVVDTDFVLGNVNAENTWIHILGRFVTPEQNDVSNDEDEDAEWEEDDEDEEWDEDEEDESEDFFVHGEDDDVEDDEPLYTPKSKVVIEELPSDSEDNKDETQVSTSSNKTATRKTEGEPEKKRARVDVDIKKQALPADSKKNTNDKKKTPSGTSSNKKEGSKVETKTNVSKKDVASAAASEKPSKTAKQEKATTEGSSAAAKSESKPPASDVASDPKPSKKNLKSHDASKVVTDSAIAVDKVRNFVLEELKKSKEIKGTELGNAIAKRFGTPFKKMGFEEKTLAKFLDLHAKNQVVMENDTFKLK